MATLHLTMVLLIASASADIAPSESEKLAIAELRKLGAKVVLHPPAADPKAEPELKFVLIDTNWKGGDEGLDQIEKLPKLPKLFITGRPKISEERLAKLKESMPDLAIGYRTKVVFGITAITHVPADGCHISSVLEGTPAAQAGLVPNDVIKKLDGILITNFDDLVKELSRKEPGEEAKLTVLREDKEIIVKVKLRAWE